MTAALVLIAWCGLLYWGIHSSVAVYREFTRE